MPTTSVKTPKGTTLPLFDIKGKAYLQVAHRLVWFREEHADYSITTEIVELGTTHAVCRATIATETGAVLATATKRETQQGFADFLEKAETGAIGRALALCGYGTQFTEDLDEGARLADSPIARPTTTHREPGTPPERGSGGGTAGAERSPRPTRLAAALPPEPEPWAPDRGVYESFVLDLEDVHTEDDLLRVAAAIKAEREGDGLTDETVKRLGALWKQKREEIRGVVAAVTGDDDEAPALPHEIESLLSLATACNALNKNRDAIWLSAGKAGEVGMPSPDGKRVPVPLEHLLSNAAHVRNLVRYFQWLKEKRAERAPFATVGGDNG